MCSYMPTYGHRNMCVQIYAGMLCQQINCIFSSLLLKFPTSLIKVKKTHPKPANIFYMYSLQSEKLYFLWYLRFESWITKVLWERFYWMPLTFFFPVCTELEFQDCWVMSFSLIKLARGSLKSYGLYFCSIRNQNHEVSPALGRSSQRKELVFNWTTRVLRSCGERHREHQTKVCFWKSEDSFDVSYFEGKLRFAEDWSCNEGCQLV